MAKALVNALIGADMDSITPGTLNASSVSVTGAGARFPLGTVVVGTDGTEYTYVQAGSSSGAMASTRAANAYAIGKDYRANLMTSARAAAGLGLGFGPQLVIAAHDYFWARTKPSGTGVTVRVAANASADKWLRTTITKGVLGTASTASAVVFPVVVTTAAGASLGVQTVPALAARLNAMGVQTIASALAPI